LSRQQILRDIGRMENLADALYGSSIEEINSLVGQLEGTIYSINDGFREHGISPRIGELADLGHREFGPDNVHELTRIIQHAAARFRSMANGL